MYVLCCVARTESVSYQVSDHSTFADSSRLTDISMTLYDLFVCCSVHVESALQWASPSGKFSSGPGPVAGQVQ